VVPLTVAREAFARLSPPLIGPIPRFAPGGAACGVAPRFPERRQVSRSLLPPSDALTPDEHVYLAEAVASKYAYLRDTVDVQGADELSLDEVLSSDYCAYAGSASVLLPSSELRPLPSTRCKEVPLRQACRVGSPDRLRLATALELEKQIRLRALGPPVLESLLPFGAIVVDAHVLYKLKADGRETCRIAVMGNRIAPVATEQTFASVISDGAKLFSIAAMQAHCEERQEELILSDGDVVGGFLHIPLDSPVPMFLRLPRNLPHPLAGKLLPILSAIYGLRESNRLFSLEMSRVIREDAGFVCTPGEPQCFVKFASGDSERKCIACVTVDDVLAISNDQVLVDSLFAALAARFGPLTFNAVSTSHTGLEFSRPLPGALSVTQDGAIARAASLVGVSHLPSVAVPGLLDFFQPPVELAECVPVDSSVYSSLTGQLVQFLKTRHDIRPYVSYLCSFNSSPLEGHYRRALHVLRYLHSTPGMGGVFKSCGGSLCAESDAAFGVFPSGRSSSGYLLSIGEFNAPFACCGKIQSSVATCPMTAEYYAMGSVCMDIMHFRQLSKDLGWSWHLLPTPLKVDNKTAICLATAPQVSKKSRHIAIKHHYIRELVADDQLCLFHVPAPKMRANVLTKFLPKSRYLAERDVLFNRAVLTLV